MLSAIEKYETLSIKGRIVNAIVINLSVTLVTFSDISDISDNGLRHLPGYTVYSGTLLIADKATVLCTGVWHR